MKTKMMLAVLVIGMTLTVGSACGQTVGRVNIPFDFNIGNSTLPGGEYTLDRVFVGSSPVLAIRSSDGHRQIAVHTNPAEPAKTPTANKLVFHRYGEQQFLSEIWVTGKKLALPVSNRERKVARSTRVQEASILAK